MTAVGKHLLCSTGKPRDSVPCHPSTPHQRSPGAAPAITGWAGVWGGLIRSQLAALLMRESRQEPPWTGIRNELVGAAGWVQSMRLCCHLASMDQEIADISYPKGLALSAPAQLLKWSL